MYDETWSTDFQGRVTVAFDVGKIEAIIRGGYLISIVYGSCVATGALELEGNLMARKLVPLPVDIALEWGLPIDQ